MSPRNWKSFFSADRHVNLIYFVDAAKTKTVRVSLRTASIMAIACGVVVLWSFASGVLLVRLEAKQSDLRSELSTSRAVIFEYQTLHDGVFERAYPEVKDRKFAAASIPPGKQTAAVEPEKASPKATEAPVMTDTPEKAKMVSREDPKSPVSLSNPSVIRRDGVFEVFFDLRNSDSSKKAEGYIWGIAAVERQGGERISLTVPKSLTVSVTGDPLNTEHGQRFGIRRYARRSFIFSLPSRFEGRVLTVDIAFSGQAGKYSSSYTIPVNLRFSNLASNAKSQDNKAVKESTQASDGAVSGGEASESSDDEG